MKNTLTIKQYCKNTPYPRDINSILEHVVQVEDWINHLSREDKPDDSDIRRINLDLRRDRKPKNTLASLYVLFRSALPLIIILII